MSNSLFDCTHPVEQREFYACNDCGTPTAILFCGRCAAFVTDGQHDQQWLDEQRTRFTWECNAP